MLEKKQRPSMLQVAKADSREIFSDTTKTELLV